MSRIRHPRTVFRWPNGEIEEYRPQRRKKQKSPD